MPPPAADDNSALRQLYPNEVIAGRFRIVQFLARGGMGEVFEAVDLHLQNKHCALKTIRPELASDPAMRLRFEREVLLAREVQHPNVCPTYDLFHLEGPRGPLTILTMKLVRGESLQIRLHRSGPFPADSALAIARHMAAGLDAAHRAGVIHRDFKPANIMLEQTGADARVLITDFGLSRAYADDATLAQTGRVHGTLGYIAPEILQGRPATPASDVFSFGIVLHELLTGAKPEYQTASNSYTPPSAVVENLPPAWDKVILGCLHHDPARRFQSAGEALELLAQRSSASRRTRVPGSSSRRSVIAAAAAVVALAAGAWWVRAPVRSLLHPLPARRFVALLAWPPTQDAAQRPILNSVLDAVGASLARDESAVKDLLIISSSDVTRQAPISKPSEALPGLGANLVLAASLQATHSEYILLLQVLDAASGRVLRSQEITIRAEAVGDLREKAALATADILDLPARPRPLNDKDELAHLSPAAFKYFTVAEDFAAQPNYTGLDSAIENYQKALESDPHFSLGYARLAIAFAQRYQTAQDKALLDLAAHNADLAVLYNPDSAQAFLSRALADAYSGRTEAAMQGFAKALQLDPGNPQVLYYKALALRDLGQPLQAAEVYLEILKERPNYWPAYNELGFVFSRTGEYDKAAESYAQAAAVAPHVALPLASLGTMYMNLHRNGQAVEAFEQSLKRAPNAQAYFGLGDIAFEKGDYRAALDAYSKARDLRPRSDVPWRDIGDCYMMLGATAQVRESYVKAADLLARALEANPHRGVSWMTLAFYEAKIGRRGDALDHIQKAESLGATDPKSQLEKAEALALLGRKEEALQLVLECMRKGISTVEVELALDLKEIRTDPRYSQFVKQHPAK